MRSTWALAVKWQLPPPPIKRAAHCIPPRLSAVLPQVVEPPFEKPLGITIERKIKKLAEYLDKNEHRAPKASGGCCCWAFLIWLAHAD